MHTNDFFLRNCVQAHFLTLLCVVEEKSCIGLHSCIGRTEHKVYGDDGYFFWLRTDFKMNVRTFNTGVLTYIYEVAFRR